MAYIAINNYLWSSQSREETEYSMHLISSPIYIGLFGRLYKVCAWEVPDNAMYFHEKDFGAPLYSVKSYQLLICPFVYEDAASTNISHRFFSSYTYENFKMAATSAVNSMMRDLTNFFLETELPEAFYK